MFSKILNPYSYWMQIVCFLSAWLLLSLFVGNIVTALIDLVKRSRLMHQIPCHSCQYFNNSYHLKCTIHPEIANTESAINCADFQPQSHY